MPFELIDPRELARRYEVISVRDPGVRLPIQPPFAPPVVPSEARDVFADYIALEAGTGGRYVYPAWLRAAGAHVRPRNVVSIVFASGAPGARRRPVSIVAIDVDRARPTYGRVVDRQVHIAEIGRSGLGFDQATYVTDAGQGGLLLYSDPDDAERVRLIDVAAITGRARPAVVRGLPSDAIGRPLLAGWVRPALARDVEARPGRVFMAYAEPSGRVVAGFLQRGSSGAWSFRFGGQAKTDKLSVRPGSGVSLVRPGMFAPVSAFAPIGWTPEVDLRAITHAPVAELWPPMSSERRPPDLRLLQRYVRAPRATVCVAVSVTGAHYNPIGELGYTFLRDSAGPGEP